MCLRWTWHQGSYERRGCTKVPLTSRYAWSSLGAALQAAKFPFGVVTASGQRYHPAITAQAAATLCQMFPACGKFEHQMVTDRHDRMAIVFLRRSKDDAQVRAWPLALQRRIRA